MSLITVDTEKCVKCELCIKACPVSVLKMEKIGPAEIQNSTCIACGHCVAICPTAAIDNEKAPLAKQVEIKDLSKISALQAEVFLRSRRSIRNYKDISVPKETLIKLLEIARLAPTATNSQNISFVAVQNRQLLEKAAAICVQMLETSPLRHLLEAAIRGYREDGIDTIFRGAPNLVIAVADKNFPFARANAISYLTYLELYAPSLELGSCWAGIFEHCASADNSPLPHLFNIPEDKTIAGAIMLGYPKYSYQRLVDRNPLDATFID